MTARTAEGLLVRPIGVLRTPHRTQRGTPIQPSYAGDAEGEAALSPEYVPALADVAGFERVWLVYWLDRARPYAPTVVPYRDHHPRGLFATRAPARPNPIGLSVVRVLGVEGATLRFRDADMLDGTPLLDIKPYVPDFDAFPGARAGWLDTSDVQRDRADGRFEPAPASGPETE